ncbi:MAG: hypothetical protein H7062_16920 [Candidatus Saccharimonas sp.]|nr:hypothetical protein [Planctomycetaceae bacterium]
MSPAWDRAAVVGTRTFVLMILPVCWLISMALPRDGRFGDVSEGLVILFLIACVVGIPVSVGNAFLACWLADNNRLSAVYVAMLLAVLADFALVGGYLSVCLLIW